MKDLKVTEIMYTAVKNCGNCQTERLEVRVALNDDDDPDTVFKAVKNFTLSELGMDHDFKSVTAGTIQPDLLNEIKSLDFTPPQSNHLYGPPIRLSNNKWAAIDSNKNPVVFDSLDMYKRENRLQ